MLTRPDPIFPSASSLKEAGLTLTAGVDLDLPAYSGIGRPSGGAVQVLGGRRYGRDVRSGFFETSGGRILVRTGISSELPAFSCEIRDGHLLSYNSPMEVNSMVLSRRVGPGRVIIVNDGEWLVIDRLLHGDLDEDSSWLLLRQLRDISLAEILAASSRYSCIMEEGKSVFSEDRVYEGCNG